MKKNVGMYLRTFSYGFVFCLTVLVAIIPAFLIACLPARWRYNMRFLYWIEYWVYWMLSKALWVPITITGKQHLPKKRAVIFAANHQSALDIVMLGLLARGHAHLWVLWHGLLKYPIFGFFVNRMNVVVNTDSPRKAVQALHQGIALLKQNNHHVMIFPEGRRYTDGKVHDFFRGFAIIAKETKRPVVPVMLINTARVCAPRTVWVRYAPIHIIIGAPFTYQEGDTDQQFLERVHAWFKEHEPHE